MMKDIFDDIRKVSESVWVGECIMSYEKLDNFIMDQVTYTITTKTNKTFRMTDSNGIKYSYKTFNGKSYYGESKQVRMFEDKFKSIILLDLLNCLNPLHEISHLTYRLLKRLT